VSLPLNPLQSEPIKRYPRALSTSARIGLWFACLLIALSLFSLFPDGGRAFLFVFWIAAMFAVPVGCLYLPLVAKLRDAQQRRWLVLIGTGTVIGPVALAVLGLVAMIAGRDPYLIWVGDGEDPFPWRLAPWSWVRLPLCCMLPGSRSHTICARRAERIHLQRPK